MTATAQIDTVQSEQITWADRSGTAEASDLGLHAGYWPENLLVKSAKTGTHLRFARHAQETREGDLLLVRYLAVADGKFVTLTVYND